MFEKSIFDDEWERNEEKRSIKIIAPSKIRTVLREFERIMLSE